MRPRKACEICSSRPARLVLLRRKADVDYRTFVCPECAAERARLYSDSPLDFFQLRRSGGADEPDSPRCPLCGSILVEAGADATPGCCECYVKFAEVFDQAVRAVQGSGRHIGKTPGR